MIHPDGDDRHPDATPCTGSYQHAPTADRSY